MMTDQTSPQDFRNDRMGKYSHIKGWGIDINPSNDPTYPIKKRNNAEHEGYVWERPQQQEETVEILQSVERPNITAVYGTARPPSGLSGMIRRLAYQYSESSYGRWLPLVLADRIQVAEGILEDFSKGYIPNIPKEIGMKSDWKYNKKAFFTKLTIGALLVAVAVVAVMSPSADKSEKLS
ncbi:hypothetical protein [Flavobacterium limi]|uniref:Uncharacterized protein n=1 Tax=Flavobacterium limi TaxID=2045105 RepID=A0ABQ1UWD4_9FLAO|nr:hypothetical protein [Flavobacterium limi]GGF28412.1 hypothetical protein GCM10011518_42180 [Flavobacterium limi]